MKGRSGLLFALALAVAATSLPARAGEKFIYIQKRDDGVIAFTDTKPAHGTYKAIPIHGRLTASASCAGMTPALMQERAHRYSELIEKHALAHGLSPELVSAVVRVESCYDPRAVSRSGARGLMQLMPTTAAQLGVYDSFDPEQNIAGGVRYLAAMLKRFGNNVRLALAAYNAGPEAVEAYNGIPPYQETTSYVGRILKLYKTKY